MLVAQTPRETLRPCLLQSLQGLMGRMTPLQYNKSLCFSLQPLCTLPLAQACRRMRVSAAISRTAAYDIHLQPIDISLHLFHWLTSRANVHQPPLLSSAPIYSQGSAFIQPIGSRTALA